MTLGAPLGGLTQDQGAAGGPVAIPTGTGAGARSTAARSRALFEVRDRIVPEFDAEIDRYANDLIERFRDLMPAGGARRARGDGLFVDRQSGAADRPRRAHRSSTLRSTRRRAARSGGCATASRAAAPGDEGFGGYLQALADAMVEPRTPAGFVSQNADSGGAAMASEIACVLRRPRRAQRRGPRLPDRPPGGAGRAARPTPTGVDTDGELQSLILVEQTYAANARVLSVIDGLMKLLLEG